jgi:hypothetical protein
MRAAADQGSRSGWNSADPLGARVRGTRTELGRESDRSRTELGRKSGASRVACRDALGACRDALGDRRSAGGRQWTSGGAQVELRSNSGGTQVERRSGARWGPDRAPVGRAQMGGGWAEGRRRVGGGCCPPPPPPPLLPIDSFREFPAPRPPIDSSTRARIPSADSPCPIAYTNVCAIGQGKWGSHL